MIKASVFMDKCVAQNGSGLAAVFYGHLVIWGGVIITYL